MPRAKKKPSVDGSIVLAVDDTDEGNEFVDAVQALVDSYDGLTFSYGFLAVDGDEDADEDDEQEDEDEEEAEDEDEEGGDDEEGEGYTEDELNEMDTADLKEVLAEWEIELDGRFSKKKAIEAILDAYESDEEGEEDEDEEEQEFDEDTLAEMGLTELKGLYKDLSGKTPRKGMKKDALIESILEFAEEE